MKKLLFTLVLLLVPSLAWAQCNGVFGANQVCGSTSGGPPVAVPSTSFPVTLPALPNNTVWVGSIGNVATAQTIGGDCTTTNAGVITCTKTNNVAFAPSATTDTTNASNISSGTLASARFSAIKSVNVQVFTSSGTYTPTPNMLFVDGQCVGGGAAGGGTPTTGAGQNAAGGGGAAGGYARGVFSAATIGASKAVVIGSGGAGVAGGNGNAGGQTTFGGTLLIANGGGSGPAGVAQIASVTGGANGGTASTSSTVGAGISFQGQGGYDGWSFIANATVSQGGAGGNSFFGGAGSPAMVESGSPINGVGANSFGSGGSGAAVVASQASTGTGGSGSGGLCIMTEFIGP